MAKKSKIAKNEQRKEIVARYAERRRELKLAGADRRVIRWMWKDLMNERAFEAQLVEAGVPRAR